MHGWRWIFIIEGLITALVGLLALIALPAALETAKFLTEDERLVLRERLRSDRPASAAGEGFEWRHVRMAVFSIQVSR